MTPLTRQFLINIIWEIDQEWSAEHKRYFGWHPLFPMHMKVKNVLHAWRAQNQVFKQQKLFWRTPRIWEEVNFSTEKRNA